MGYVIDFGHDTTKLPSKFIYGIKFSSSNPGTRLLDSKNLVFQAGIRDDFANIEYSPFNTKECVTKYNSSTGKQEVLAYKGDSNWSSAVSDSNHNVMIEFPKFYYKRPNRYEWLVSYTQYDGFQPSAMHYRNGVMHDHVYIGKYKCNSSYRSQSGQTIYHNSSYNNDDGTGITINTYRTGIRSQGMFMLDYPCAATIQMLSYIKYGVMDIPSVIGYEHSGVYTTGQSDSLTIDGCVSSDMNGANRILGIENFYSGIWIFVDGLCRVGNSDMVYYNTNIESITTTPTKSTIQSSWTRAQSTIPYNTQTSSVKGGVVNGLCYESGKHWLLYPTSIINWDGTGTSIMNDSYWYYYRGSNDTVITMFGSHGGNYFYSVDRPTMAFIDCVAIPFFYD